MGFYTTQGATSDVPKGFILQGSTFTSFAHPKAVRGTFLTGINKFNSTVGWYLDSANIAHGFKRYSNGGLVSLNYPGGSRTQALGTNDHGTVVGSFVTLSGGQEFGHGFLYHGGTWAQVDYSTNPGTSLDAISDANVVIGTSNGSVLTSVFFTRMECLRTFPFLTPIRRRSPTSPPTE